MSVSTENFLKTIYLIRYDEKNKAISSRLAGRLNVSKAAVTDMAKNLAEKKLIRYTPYQEILLTQKGKEMAVKVIRRHRLWELFITRVLNLTSAEVHDEAEKLEHHTSDFLIGKIDEFLNYPRFDPHGDPIPDDQGIFPSTENIIGLNQAKKGITYKIARLNHKNQELSSFFEENGFRLGTKIKIVKHLVTDLSVFLLINNQKMVISEKIAGNIYVSSLSGKK